MRPSFCQRSACALTTVVFVLSAHIGEVRAEDRATQRAARPRVTLSGVNNKVNTINSTLFSVVTIQNLQHQRIGALEQRAQIQGASGPQGPAGPEGLQGPVGATGAVGPQGPAGVNIHSCIRSEVWITAVPTNAQFANKQINCVDVVGPDYYLLNYGVRMAYGTDAQHIELSAQALLYDSSVTPVDQLQPPLGVFLAAKLLDGQPLVSPINGYPFGMRARVTCCPM